MSEWESIVTSGKPTTSYGTCVRATNKPLCRYMKHSLSKSDTLQGIALKYGTTTEELRRINKLYSSDSMFIRSYLMVPYSENCSSNLEVPTTLTKENQTKVAGNQSTAVNDAKQFLENLDSKIMLRKKAVNAFKIDEESITDNVTPTATLGELKAHPKTIFSHSNSDNDNLFRL
ncbi:lysM and putative peptidoglycan-binding domain-containing protein 2 [Ciona intestinalis]